jgi:hypothetical protein
VFWTGPNESSLRRVRSSWLLSPVGAGDKDWCFRRELTSKRMVGFVAGLIRFRFAWSDNEIRKPLRNPYGELNFSARF